MLRRTVRLCLALVLAVVVAAGTSAAAGGKQVGGQATTPWGPPYEYMTEIMIGKVIGLRNRAIITRTEHGYLYRAGYQNSRLVIKPVPAGLRFADTGTQRWERLGRGCRARKARVGVAAVCRVPDTISVSRPLLVEVWPRLGDDYVDGSRLPATFAMTVLSDKGHDVARLGAGPDFFNGHYGHDRVFGGGGNDWIRGGFDNDRVSAGPGTDKVVTGDGHDTIYGGQGDDLLWAGDGNDSISAGDGRDLASCGNGADGARVDAADTVRDCESVARD